MTTSVRTGELVLLARRAYKWPITPQPRLRLFSTSSIPLLTITKPYRPVRSPARHHPYSQSTSTSNNNNMSSGFSNANVPSDKPNDPYKAKNLDSDATLETKIHDLLAFVKAQKFGLMTTRQKSSGLLMSRCMAIAGEENGIDLVFHTNTESGKTDEIDADPHVNMGFLNSSGEWASISGVAEIITDREMVKKYYSSHLKAWVGDLGDGVHNGSASDPRIGVIRINTVTATYAVSQATAAGRMAEIAKGVVTGSAANVNKLREIDAADVQTWRTSKAMVQ